MSVKIRRSNEPAVKNQFGSHNSTQSALPVNGNVDHDSTVHTMRRLPFCYEKIQSLVQAMLLSESGVPVRSHRNKLLTAVPSVFTGSDLVNWLYRKLNCSKSEAAHIALLVYKHGYVYCVDKTELHIKEDNTLFRFQTPHLWPSQNFDDSDYTYSIFLLKQIKSTKKNKGVFLADYQMSDLRTLQSKLSRQWNEINSRADDEFRVLKEQRKIARHLIMCQERAFWRLRRPPPGELKFTDCSLSKFGIEGNKQIQFYCLRKPFNEVELVSEVEFLKKATSTPTKTSTTFEKVTQNCSKYSNFDPILHTPTHGNPWTTNDDTIWTLEKSLVEYPNERKLKKWACSLDNLLKDVTGRYNFELFCKKQYCCENLRFWQAVQDLRTLPLAAVPDAVQLIFNEFIDPNATDLINISALAFTEAEQDLNKPSRYSFCLAEKEIYKLMEADVYPRYLKSDFDKLMKSATNSGSIGRSFIKKLISRSGSIRSESIEIASPCHPKRYTKRELSIGKKKATNAPSGSVDNIFLTSTMDEVTDLVPSFHTTVENLKISHGADRRISAPVIKFFESSTKPTSQLVENGHRSIAASTTSPSASQLSCVKEEHPKKQQLKVYGSKLPVTKSMISRSMEDLSHLADEEKGMALAMHQDTFQMGLMSLRQPTDNFNLFDQTSLDRNKYDAFYDLYQDPEANLSPSFTSPVVDGRDDTRALFGTLNILKFPNYVHSSNESIHSTISVC